MATVLEKCGYVITSLSSGEREYFLTCMFCSSSFSSLETFVAHLEDTHLLEGSDQEYLEIIDNPEHEHPDVIIKAEKEETNVSVEIELLNSSTQEDIQHIKESPNYITETEYITSDVEFDETMENFDTKIVNRYAKNEMDFSDTEVNKYLADDHLKLYDKETLKTIFTKFEKHSILWDRHDPTTKNIYLRSTAYKSLASDVGKQDDWKNVRDLLRKFSYRLRQELERKRKCLSTGEHYIPWWIEDMESFLKIRIENKKCFAPEGILTGGKLKIFLKYYKRLTCLWNEVDIDYRLPNKRQEAMITLKSLLESSNISLTNLEIEQEIARFRKVCCQEKKRKFKCEAMKLQYIPQYPNYDEISFLEIDVGPFKCDICKEILSGLNALKVHKAKHDGTKPFTCPLCGNGFSTVHSMNIHLNRHTGDYKYKCKYCEKSFPASSELIVHERSHTGERPYVCDQCGKTFRVWVYYDTHLRRHQNRRSYKCEICSKAFFGAHNLNEHMNIHRKERDLFCNICGKGFKIAKYLRQHKLIHSVVKKYVCRICHKAFAQNAGLNGHMKTHGTKVIGNGLIFDTLTI
uniref:Zinc finger protein 26 n=2 Tax=Ceratitis capitata TaxID=7213 RepID=W8C0J9_CERCA